MTDYSSHPLVMASESSDNYSGDSMFTRVGDAVQHGTLGAVTSGLLSIAHTFVDEERTGTTDDVLNNLGLSGSADYYREHKEGVDMAGFMFANALTYGAGSLALRALRAGVAGGAVARATNFIPNANKKAVAEAVESIAGAGGSLRTQISSSTVRRLGWATADSVLTNAAGETMSALLLQNSPFMEGYSAKDFAVNVGLFGGVGGLWNWRAGNKVLTTAGLLVEKQLRAADTVFNPAAYNLKKQNEMSLLVESLVGLSDQAAPLSYTYKYAGQESSVTLQTEEKLRQARKSALRSGLDTLALQFNELAAGNNNVGQSMFEQAKSFLAGDLSTEVAKRNAADSLRGLLGTIGSLHPNTVMKEITGEADALFAMKSGLANREGKLVTNLHTPGETFDTPFRLLPGAAEKDIKIVSVGSKYATREDAFADGYDIVYSKRGVPQVNPESTRITKAVTPRTSQYASIDLETLGFNYEPVHTAADAIVVASKDVQVTPRGVTIAGKEFPIARESAGLPYDISTVESSARWIRASQMTAEDLNRLGKIHTDDLPLLARAQELQGAGKLSPKLRIVDNELGELALQDVGDLARFTESQKVAWLRNHIDEVGKVETREAAVHVNSSRAWVESVIDANFDPSRVKGQSGRSTINALSPRSIAAKLDNQTQWYRGTDEAGKPIKGSLYGWIVSNEFDGKKLANEVFGIDISTKPDLSDVAGGPSGTKGGMIKEALEGMKKSDGEIPGVMMSANNLVTGKVQPLHVHVDKPVSAATKAATGGTFQQIVAHELGHAMDAFLATSYQALEALHESVDKSTPWFMANNELKAEMKATSMKFRPQHWRADPAGHPPKGEELFADNFATWMLHPERRSNMPLFAELFADKLEPYNSYFQQRVRERVDGPMLGKDAMLSAEYELKIKRQAAETAVRTVLGEDAANLVDPAAISTAGANSFGAGSGALTAADANYGDQLKTWVNSMGRWVEGTSLKRKDAALSQLKGHSLAIAANPAAAADLSAVVTRIRRDVETEWHLIDVPMRGGEGKTQPRIVSAEVKALVDAGEEYTAAEAKLTAQGKPTFLPVRHFDTFEFLRTHTQLNAQLRAEKSVLMSAVGLTMKENSTRIYVPPVDTARYPHVAIVRARQRVGNINDVTMITAKDAEQLRIAASRVPDEFEVLFKDNTSAYFEAKGSYDYQHVISDSRINSQLQRAGVLSDFFPETRAENVLSDFFNYHANQQTAMVRHAAELFYGQQFAELRFLSKQYRQADNSVARGMLATKAAKVQDPFGDYVKTALNISKQGEFPVLDAMNELVDKVGTKAYETLFSNVEQAKKGLISWQAANTVMDRFGIGTPFTGWTDYLNANTRIPRNLVGELVAKGNSIMATFGLRLDNINAMVNILSTPIMIATEVASIKQLASKDPKLAGALAEVMTVADPASGMRVPSTTKMMANAVKEYFADDGKLMAKYKPLAGMTDFLETSRSMYDDVAYKPWQTGSEWAAKMDKWVEKGSKWTGNTFAEQFTRFVSANIMDQMTRPLVAAGKITEQEAKMYMSTFVNRVQGNYLASQRPALFQGTAGRAVSLFQTYSFNVFQQLLRHVDDGNVKTLMTFGAMQANMYGLNGLPYFDAVNQHLVGNKGTNPTHKTAYSELPDKFGAIGEWALYGTPSAFPLFDGHGPAVYSRGDLSPRTMIGLPTSFADIPAVSGASRLISTVSTMATQLGGGASLTSAMLQALEHQGFSRPLAGFAQVVQGRSTDKSGKLISAANDLNNLSTAAWIQDRAVTFGGVTRILGAKPMDEAIMLDAIYRDKGNKLRDRQRLEDLGSVVRQKLADRQTLDQDELHEMMGKYAASGGTHDTFVRELQRWTKEANVSTVNDLASKMNNPYAKRLQVLMGGKPHPDYYNQEVDPDWQVAPPKQQTAEQQGGGGFQMPQLPSF